VNRLWRIARVGVEVVALPIALIALWWWASSALQTFYLPSPGTVAQTFDDVWFGSRLLDDVLPSVVRLLGGFGLACVLGIGLGVAIGSSARLRALVEPVLEFLRAIPPPVMVPLLILLAGIGNTMKVLVIVSGCVWPILLNTVEGVRAVDPVLQDTCRCYRIGRFARFRHLVLRAASPQIMTGVRLALPVAIILMVISEMFASSSGLGFTIKQFQDGFDIPEMWTGIVLLGLLGILFAAAYWLVERRVLFWYHGTRPTK
jgi:ABC-type nitrate/sulfonate/bicarbonate transport system permease component